jgi:hypothetical protein
MSIALTGFITGLAKGATSRVEKEREENEAIIQNRLKQAQTNRTLRQKEIDAQQQLLRTRLGTVSSYLPPDATEEQKLALISNEEISKQFVDLRSKGQDVDLNRFLIMNRDKVPQNFNTVQQYIDGISAAPTAVPQQQVDAIRQTRGALGARVGPNIEKLAQQYGVSAGQLLAYEDRTAIPQVPQFARMNVEMLAKDKDKDFTARLKDAEVMFADAVEQFGMGSQEAALAKARFDFLKSANKHLNPEQAKFSDILGNAKVHAESLRQRFGDDSPQYAAARNEVIRMENQFKTEKDKAPSLGVLRATLREASSNAVMERYGNLIGNGIAVSQDNEGNPVLNITGLDPQKQQEVREYGRNALRHTLFRYLDEENRPLTAEVETALRSFGIQFDEAGRAVFGGQGPRRDAAPPQQSTKTRTRAQVQAVADANNVSYDVAAQGAIAQGYTIID